MGIAKKTAKEFVITLSAESGETTELELGDSVLGISTHALGTSYFGYSGALNLVASWVLVRVIKQGSEEGHLSLDCHDISKLRPEE